MLCKTYVRTTHRCFSRSAVWTGLALVVIIRYIDAHTFRLEQCGKFDLKFSRVIRGHLLTGSVLISMTNVTTKQCYYSCARHEDCKTVNIHKSKECQLNGKEHGDPGVALVESKDWTYVETEIDARQVGPVCQLKNPCVRGDCTDICESPGFTCRCYSGRFSGERCNKDMEINFHDGKQGIERYPYVRFSFKAESLSGLTGCTWFSTASSEWRKKDVGFFSLHKTHDKGAYICNSPVLFFKTLANGVHVSVAFGGNDNFATTIIKDGQPYHVCFTWQISKEDVGGEEGEIYLDGKKEANFPYPGNILLPGVEWRLLLGNDLDPSSGDDNPTCKVDQQNQAFYGNISHAYLWKRKMDASEIQNIYDFTDMYKQDQILSWDMFSEAAQKQTDVYSVVNHAEST